MVAREQNLAPEAREVSVLPEAERLPALRSKNREFLSRVFAYSGLSPERICPVVGGARHSETPSAEQDCDHVAAVPAAVAKQAVEIVGGVEHDLKRDFRAEL
jgi:hypothetical protein